MTDNYYGVSQTQFNKFFEKNNEKYFMNYIMELLNNLSQKIQFTLKPLSVQFHIMKGTEPFAAFGFRKKQKISFFFIEFYSKDDINDEKIIKKTKKDIMIKNKKFEYIINLIEIKMESKIDNQIIKWVEEAYKLI